MESLIISVIGPYKSGKSTLVSKLQQKKGTEEDVSFFFFKYGGKDITLIDTPGDLDNPTLIASVLSVSDAVLFCLPADAGVNAQVGEMIVLVDSAKIKQGLVCITKTDISTAQDIQRIKSSTAVLFKGTPLEKFDVIDIDINSEQTIADMRAKISRLDYDQSKSSRPFKFLVDNAFETKGMSVAVGFLTAGELSIHATGIICPAPFTREMSVNSIQINQEEVQSANAGSRLGIAIKGVWPWDLPRGVEIRQPDSFKDVKSGHIEADVSQLYKQPIMDGSKLNLVCNWQVRTITLKNVKMEGKHLFADFESDNNFCFDGDDRIILLNKDLPIRMLRVVGRAVIS
ncbi:GTP-binding protein [Candidatus Parvarchaeota archaeon]|nr:GTP-binding protein [Candidatus Parvarchaeota archaeon]